jgi:hypothetical protein
VMLDAIVGGMQAHPVVNGQAMISIPSQGAIAFRAFNQ